MEEIKSAESIKKKTPYTRLAISGGGAKGLLYAGAYEELTESRVIAGITEIAGVSAGAITATLIALGMSPEDFRKLSVETNLGKLLGDRVSSNWITTDGKPILHLMQNTITKLVEDYFNSNGVDLDKPGLRAIKEKLDANKPISLTFEDLDNLYNADGKRFKKLTMTAVTYPNGELQVFNAKTTPNVEIALACRASVSIPIILEPVSIDLDGTRNRKTFIDGGLYDNLPTEYFDLDDDNKPRNNAKKPETLVLAFGDGLKDNENPVFRALQEGDLIPDTLLKHIIDDAVAMRLQPKYRSSSIIKLMNTILYKNKEAMELNRNDFYTLRNAINKLPKSTANSNDNATILASLKDQLTKQPKPRFYYASYLEQFKRDVLVKWLAGFKGGYKNTEQKNISFERIHNEYRTQTIHLRAGNIKTTDFDVAEIHAREMCVLGSLDTKDYLKTTDESFYEAVLIKYKRIYSSVLLGAKQNLDHDKLWLDIKQSETEGKTATEIVNTLIRPQALQDINGVAAFSLCRAVEWEKDKIAEKDLLTETHARAKQQQGVISQTAFDKAKAQEFIDKYKGNREQFFNKKNLKRSEIIVQTLFEEPANGL